MPETTRLLARSDVERLLDVHSCIAAVEDAFRLAGRTGQSPGAVLGVHVAGGGFHAKAAYLELARPYFVVKVNGNFPGNPAARGLPTIQGVALLFDAACGTPLAVIDSMSITTLRTAAASAVAARHLARANASVATVVGCGVQGRAHVAAIAAVRALRTVHLFDADERHATRLADELRATTALEIHVARDLAQATRASDIVVTATSATQPFLFAEHVSPGTFVAAVGADNEHKHEIDPGLVRRAAVVVDDLAQCATIGDLHHAIAADAVSRDHVRATLAGVVAGTQPGRADDDEIVIFDSTGVAIEDVAAAAVVYERALLDGTGLELGFAS